VLRSSNEGSGIWAFGWTSSGLVETILSGLSVLTGAESPVVVTGYAYWLLPLLLDGESENAVDVAERVGEGLHGASRETVGTPFRVWALCAGRSL